jgi:hypothetical protein
VSTFDVQDGPDSEALVRRVIEIIESTRTLPLSSSVKLDNREEVLELLEEALERLPADLRQARWMLKERDEYRVAQGVSDCRVVGLWRRR